MVILSHVVKHNSLVSQEEWVSYISSLENSFDDLETNKERAKRIFKEKFIHAVKQRATGKFAVLLSGGVDSTLIALVLKQLGYQFPCYTLGLKDSKDALVAEEVAKEYGLLLKKVTISYENLESVFVNVLHLLKEPDVVKIEVGSVLWVLLEEVIKDGYHEVFGGLGSEEIFCGYQRHDEALAKGFEDLHAECWRGLKGMWDRDLVRDFTVAHHFNVTLLAPFLDTEVILAAMKIHPMFKIDTLQKKIVLREIAEEIGLRKDFARRKKIAAQYGSNVDIALERIAKKKGMKKKEFLEHSL